MKKLKAFTLIEMLVVIAIMGILAALVVNMIAGANAAKRKAVVEAEKQSLTMIIASYQSKLNYYPPDNGQLATAAPANYASYAALNPLLYELTGATNIVTANEIQLFDGTIVSSITYQGTYNRAAVNNALTDEAPKNFFSPGPQPREYTNYVKASAAQLKGLIVPVDGLSSPNFWYYDSSSTNRHNLSSYDLWAEYTSSSRGGSNIITTNGNW